MVRPDNARPRLYIKKGHIKASITAPADVAKRYALDNSGDPNGAEEAFGT